MQINKSYVVADFAFDFTFLRSTILKNTSFITYLIAYFLDCKVLVFPKTVDWLDEELFVLQTATDAKYAGSAPFAGDFKLSPACRAGAVA